MVGAAELTEGVELGLSSSKTEAGSWKGMLGPGDCFVGEMLEPSPELGPRLGAMDEGGF